MENPTNPTENDPEDSANFDQADDAMSRYDDPEKRASPTQDEAASDVIVDPDELDSFDQDEADSDIIVDPDEPDDFDQSEADAYSYEDLDDSASPTQDEAASDIIVDHDEPDNFVQDEAASDVVDEPDEPDDFDQGETDAYPYKEADSQPDYAPERSPYDDPDKTASLNRTEAASEAVDESDIIDRVVRGAAPTNLYADPDRPPSYTARPSPYDDPNRTASLERDAESKPDSGIPIPQVRTGSGLMTCLPLIVIVVLLGVIAALVFLDLPIENTDPTEEVLEASIEPLNPVPGVVMTPIFDRLATLEADESVSPEEIEALRTEIAEMNEDDITIDELNIILDELDQNFIDSDELRDELDGLLESEDFGENVLGVIEQANQQATQTQAAIECVVQNLPQYSGVRARTAPVDSAPTASIITRDLEYKVLGRTNGELNTRNLWWLIEIDARNNLTGWVRSDLVTESDDDKCMNIAVMPVGN